MQISVRLLIPNQECGRIIFAIKRWNFKFYLRKRIITVVAWHTASTALTVSTVLLRVTTVILLEFCDHRVQSIEA
jgi:hypothetical protein